MPQTAKPARRLGSPASFGMWSAAEARTILRCLAVSRNRYPQESGDLG
jgi:hypothetical protein